MKKIIFNQKVDELKDMLFAFAMKLTKNKEDAKDLYQETVLRAFDKRHRYKIGTNFKAWITTIMRNNFINDYRRKKTRNRVEQTLPERPGYISRHIIYNSGNSIIMLKELNQMLQSIKESQRKPFEMYFDGYDYKEIASKLELPIGTVKSRIFFTRKKMKDMIYELYGSRNIRRA